MRNDVLYATDGGPIVGKIKHGKRYDSGMVSAEQYSQDMATYDERMTALHQSVLAIENTAALIRSDLSSLSADYAAVVPGLADDLHELELDVVNLKNSVKAAANAVTALEAKEAGDITAVTESISTITAGLNALADLVHEHSTAIALNETGVTQLRSEITAVKALISTNTNSITQLSNAVAELSAAQQVDKNVLTERIASVNTAVTNLTQTVNASNTQMSDRITAMQSTLSTATQDIAAIKANISGIGAELESEKADIQRIEKRMTDYEVTQSTLRNQILNVSESTTDKLNVVSESQVLMRSDIKENTKAINALSAATSEAISDLNQRINDIVGHEDIAITGFSASPNVCEIGGTENITLSWSTAGEVASQKINNNAVTGNQTTMSNVNQPVKYTLTVTDPKGKSVSKSVDISFINHMYYGVDSREIINESLVKGLSKDIFSEEITRDITVSPNNQYIYYAYPKRLGGVIFKASGFQGGFENPVTVSVSNHSGYAEDYYVYRSTKKLSITITVSVNAM